MNGSAPSVSVRHQAREFRRAVLQRTPAGDEDPLRKLLPADEVIAAAVLYCGLSVTALDPGDPLLAGAMAVLDRDVQRIWCTRARSPEAARFDIAHELGHWVLHPSQPVTARCTIDTDVAEAPSPYGELYITGYSPAQRTEVDANTFAAELLVPSPLVRALWQKRVPFAEVAGILGVPQSTLRAQYAYALLADAPPPQPPPPAGSGREAPNSLLESLDASQREAATVMGRPLLVSAGPGTGKTRTLVARALFLIQNGVPPEQILALTFSNRAADEMRRRLADVVPEAAHRLWIGTFHAFGLEILRRFGHVVGIPANFRVLDPVDAVALMERHIGRLPLEDQFDLTNPILAASNILRAISRAKDEAIEPHDLAGRAGELEAEEDADRVRAIAASYAEWQRILKEERAVEFADLVYLPVQLLRRHPGVRAALRKQYRQVLVDEYQDINHASGELVRLLAGSGRGLWAVGDLRQAIYAFRGASERHIQQFTQIYPGAGIQELKVNYRSLPRLVQLFNGLSTSMEGVHRGTWSADRPGEATLVVALAETEDAQALGIARAIRQFRDQGIPFEEQAVLCRTNAQADDLAQRLADQGIPTFYLGNLLNREEIKDLLCVLSLAATEDPEGFIRVAAFPEYAIPKAQVQAIIAEVASGASLKETLARSGSEGAGRLANHLNVLAAARDAADALNCYLFQVSRYLDPLLAAEGAGTQQKRMAIYQLLTLAGNEASRHGAATPAAFLGHLRRLASTGEDVRARTPCIATNIDAVRILTVHAAKGTEFRCVFVANLAADLFPVKPRHDKPVLPGLEAAGIRNSSREDEEARLFFVAASRARDHLFLCCPLSIRGKSRRLSPLLSQSLPGFKHLAHQTHWRAAPAPRTNEQGPSVEAGDGLPAVNEISLHGLETYLDCPRRYYYERLLGGSRPSYQSTSARLAECVRETLKKACEALPSGERTLEAIEPIFHEAWSTSGLEGHPAAEQIMAKALQMTINAIQVQARPLVLKTDLDGCTVRLLADHWEQQDGRPTVERWQFTLGRPAVRPSDRYTLMRRAAADTLGSSTVRVATRHLLHNTLTEVPEDPRAEPSHLKRYKAALAGIKENRFEARPANPMRCPLCPFYFACPA